MWLLHGRLFDRPRVTDALGLPVASEESSWFPEFLETEGLILSSGAAGPVTGSGPIRPPHATGRRPAVLTVTEPATEPATEPSSGLWFLLKRGFQGHRQVPSNQSDEPETGPHRTPAGPQPENQQEMGLSQLPSP